MPTFNEQNVLFGASWDNTGFVEGINEQVAGFKTLDAQQKVAQDNFTKTIVKAEQLELEIKNLSAANIEAAETQATYNARTKQSRDEYAKVIEAQKFYESQVKKTTASVEQLDSVTQKLAVTGKQAATEQVAGAEKMSGSYNKLKLQLESYEKELADVTLAIRANELETLNLNKRNNEVSNRINEINVRLKELKLQFKGNSDEAKRLNVELGKLNAEGKIIQSQLRGAATSTKEFRIEQTALRANITTTNAAIKAQALAAKEASFAQSGLVTGVKSSFGALRTLANILPGLGISGIFLLGFEAITQALSALDLFSDKLSEVEERQSLFNDVMTEANEEAGKQIATVKVLTQAAQDETLSMDKRLQAVRVLQKEFPAYFGNLTQEAILTGDITAETNALTAAIQASARARAAKGAIDKIESQRLDVAFERQKALDEAAEKAREIGAPEKDKNTVVTDELGNVVTLTDKAEAQRINEARLEAKLKDQKDKDEALQRQEDFLIKFVGLGNIVDALDKPDKTSKTVKSTEDAYKKALQASFDLQKLLLEDEIKTNQAIANSNVLYTIKAEAAQRAADLENDLAFLTFDYQQKLGKDELLNEAQNAIAIKNINIKLNADLQKIFADRAKFQTQEAILAPEADRSAELQAAARKKVDDAISAQIKAAGADRQNIIAANESLEIQAVNQERSKGLLSEEQYQQKIKDIKERFNKQALEATIINLERQLKELDQFADSEAFNAINAKLQKAKADLTTLDAASDTKLAEFLDNVLTVENAIVGLYTSINEAEQNSLNRSIALQQQRVDNARFIAERGNAEYLALEQKRLDELQRQQAAAAEKQIAIANAVAVAQALVAIIKNIAEAPPGLGFILAAETIALIAAGYKFVSSLQPVSATFYEGTPYVEQGRHKSGRDTIPARVSIGEAIIPTDTNKQYKDSVLAIYNRTVPASVLNEFVASYPNTKIPSTDFARLGVATDYRMTEATETNKKLDRVYEVLESILEVNLGAEPVNTRLDIDGFTQQYVKVLRRKAKRNKM